MLEGDEGQHIWTLLTFCLFSKLRIFGAYSDCLSSLCPSCFSQKLVRRQSFQTCHWNEGMIRNFWAWINHQKINQKNLGQCRWTRRAFDGMQMNDCVLRARAPWIQTNLETNSEFFSSTSEEDFIKWNFEGWIWNGSKQWVLWRYHPHFPQRGLNLKSCVLPISLQGPLKHL